MLLVLRSVGEIIWSGDWEFREGRWRGEGEVEMGISVSDLDFLLEGGLERWMTEGGR